MSYRLNLYALSQQALGLIAEGLRFLLHSLRKRRLRRPIMMAIEYRFDDN